MTTPRHWETNAYIRLLMAKKRILIVTSEFPPQPGGIGTHALELGLQLHREGYVVTVVADQRSASGKEEQAFDAGLPLTVYRIARRRLRMLMYFHRLWCTWQQLAPTDVVLASGKFSLWNVAFCNLFFGRKSLAVVHGTEVNFKSYGLRTSIALALRRFSHIVAVSQYTKRMLPRVKGQVSVIPNGISFTAWQAAEVSAGKPLPGSPRLVTVGRISVRKGQALVVSHLPELLKQFPELHYHCIGLAKASEALVDTARHLGVDSHLTLHGAVAHPVLLSLLSQADLVVMLSTESPDGDVEGFCIALLEANALGIPVIGARNCGIEDAIQDGVSGLLIDAHDAQAFARAIATLLADYARFSEGARQWAKSHD